MLALEEKTERKNNVSRTYMLPERTVDAIDNIAYKQKMDKSEVVSRGIEALEKEINEASND